MTVRTFTRTLQTQLPYDRGTDVLALQQRLSELRFLQGSPDGLFGPQTAAALKLWQAQEGLAANGVCDEISWKHLFPDADSAGADRLDQFVAQLRQNHARFDGGCQWRLEPDGIHIDNNPAKGTGGQPQTIRRIWSDFGDAITRWSTRHGVPAELIVATIATESGGRPDATRLEPNYISDEATPEKISPGLMQTLISTARSTLANPAIDRNWLLQPENSIQAGSAYILSQSRHTGFDPPVVACCYNAGSVVLNEGPQNPWRMRQYPIGTSAHCDRFVEWFNDCIKVFAELPAKPEISFSAILSKAAPGV